MPTTLKRTTLALGIFICLIFSLKSFSQGRQNYYKIADEAFEKGYYQQALDLYQKLLIESPDTTLDNYPYYPTYRGFGFIGLKDVKRIQYQVAECYRNMKDYENWLIWAGKAKALSDKDFPLAQYYYAQSLLAAGKYLQAQEEFREFNNQITEYSPKYKSALNGIASTQFALSYLAKPDSLTISKSKYPLNQESSSFGVYLSPDGGSIAFSASVTENIIDSIASVKVKKSKSKKGTAKNGSASDSKDAAAGTIKSKDLKFKDIQTSKLFVAQRIGKEVKNAEMLDIPLKTGTNIGTPCFNKAMDRVIFTMWEGSNLSRECGIFYSVKTAKGEWSKPKELNRSVNLPKSRSMSPYYAEEAGLLFFSSNRSGGFGNYDIWVVNLDSSFNASNVANLGKEINSGEDETSPFYDVKTKTLYYSSNGLVGMGGFDIFRVEGEPGAFKKPENMGFPLNSSRDDQYYFPDVVNNIVFLSSDRTDCKKGCGGPSCMNIYQLEVPDYTLKGKVRDFFSKKEIPMATAIVKAIQTPLGDTSSESVIANEQGNFKAGLKKNSDYTVVASAKGYESNEPVKVSTKGLKRLGISVDTTIYLKKIIVLKSLIASAETFLPLPGAKVFLYENATNKLLATTLTDSLGNYYFELQRNKDYRVVGKKQGYLTKEYRTTTEGAKDSLKERRLLLNKIVLDKPIVIENIFYDFNKATLRPESAKPLDSLANLIKSNPGLTVEIGSHSDSKGDDKYNLRLSNLRAQAVVDYLIRKGVSRNVLLSKGYGESQPILPNNNPDGSDNPENRQINRRTEFKIVKIALQQNEDLE